MDAGKIFGSAMLILFVGGLAVWGVLVNVFGVPGQDNPLTFAQQMGNRLAGIIEQQEVTQRELIGLARDSQEAQNAYLRSQANKQNAEAVALYVVSAAAVVMVVAVLVLLPRAVNRLKAEQASLTAGERVQVISGSTSLATREDRHGVPVRFIYGKQKARVK